MYFFNFRKVELEVVVRKKIEFERKVLRIVEQFLEENIIVELLKECVCVDRLLFLQYKIVKFM